MPRRQGEQRRAGDRFLLLVGFQSLPSVFPLDPFSPCSNAIRRNVNTPYKPELRGAPALFFRCFQALLLAFSPPTWYNNYIGYMLVGKRVLTVFPGTVRTFFFFGAFPRPSPVIQFAVPSFPDTKRNGSPRRRRRRNGGSSGSGQTARRRKCR